MTTAARRVALCAVLALIALTALPPGAWASWGHKSDNGEACSRGENHHCYSIAEWLMTGGERVEGTLAYQDTTAMNVPGWASGDFVDNEEWAAFQNTGYWIEAGQTSGEWMDCCSLHPFYAWFNGSGYSQYVAPYTWPGNENNLYQLSGQSHNGTWCAYFAQTQERCEPGFPAWSNLLEVGDEIAANTKPSNAGHEDTDGWWEGTTHNWLKEFAYADGGMCISRYTLPYPALGNINYGTC
ncbi:MAG TPA: hypothetical protein VFW29_01500 [Solirubrobacteraceae bacterium]|nr:hypothetical protein [Solirubrobacteraceae bacterium]